MRSAKANSRGFSPDYYIALPDHHPLRGEKKENEEVDRDSNALTDVANNIRSHPLKT